MNRLRPPRWILPLAIILGLVLPVKAEDVTIPAELGPMLEHAARRDTGAAMTPEEKLSSYDSLVSDEFAP
jgi:hypothetical protein